MQHETLEMLASSVQGRDEDPNARAYFLEICRQDMDLWDAGLADLLPEDESSYSRLHHQAAIALNKAGEYEEALSVCERAMALGLTDKTQGGYTARVARLRKKLGMPTEAGESTIKAAVEPRPRRRLSIDPADAWVAIDFETATGDRASACSLGVAVIEYGSVVTSGSWLIQPPGNEYDPRNTKIHGIGPKHTRGAPTFGALYPEIAPFLEGRRILAHWADFDVSVLRALLALYGIETPNVRYTCSCRMAQRAFPELDDHKLKTVCRACQIPLDHHDAASDAAAAAEVALRCRDAAEVATIQEALPALGLKARIL